FARLVPQDARPAHARRLAAMPSSCSIFTLYLALDRSFLERHRLEGVNYWVEFQPGVMREAWSDLSSPPDSILLSLAPRFQKAPGADDDGTVTAEVFVAVSGDHFTRWDGSAVRKRGPDYDALKEGMVERVLERVEEAWPGCRRAIRYAEGASPLTIAS